MQLHAETPTARRIPAPRSISPEAAAIVNRGPLVAPVPFPALDDRVAWRP